MKSTIFNQRLTVFTNSFIGYSEGNIQILKSKFSNIESIGQLPFNFSVSFGTPQNSSPNQIQPGVPWFIKINGAKIDFTPNKIEVLSDVFVTPGEDEIRRMNELIDILTEFDNLISIGNITRMAYAPSFGLEGENEDSVDIYWTSIINIPNLNSYHSQERMVRYNTRSTLNICENDNVLINIVITISDGQRTERRTDQNGEIDSKTIECVIVSVDINTNGYTGNFLINHVREFCQNAQMIGFELFNSINDLKA